MVPVLWIPPDPVPIPSDGRFEGEMIVRAAVPKDFVLPPYDGDGVYYHSLIPRGQLGAFVFLREDPDYFFELLLSSFCDDRDKAVSLARRYRETL